MKLKVEVAKLAIGMYVSELDRPWLDSPFLFQGFMIESEDDLAQLREHCRYVFVDELRSRENPAVKSIGNQLAASATGTVLDEAEVARATGSEKAFRKEYQQTRQLHQKTNTSLIKILDDVRLGESVDTGDAKTLVGGLVNTISRNVSTALWLTNLRKRHEATANHCLNTSILAIAFASHLGLPKAEIAAIGIGALLHDVGIMRTPPQILDKPGMLTREEYDVVKRHPLEGHAVLKLTHTLPEISLQIIHSHHERVDGSGYPDQLKGDAIPRQALIVGIADMYDSMTSDRPYRSSVTPQEALTYMHKHATKDFGRELVEEFIKCVGIYPIGSLVLLNNGTLGIIVASNPGARLKPIVMLVRDAEGTMLRPRPLLNLAITGKAARQDAPAIARIVNPRDYGIDIAEIAAEETIS